MPRLAPNSVRIWYWLTASIAAETLERLEAVLSADERDRSQRFAFAHDRRDFVAAHVLLRRSLTLYGHLSPSEWRFEVTPRGKPRLAAEQSSPLAFSLSHTQGLVTCAVAHGTQLGVDVELVSKSIAHRDVAAHCFSEAENRRLGACPPQEYARRFAEIWTLKEAYGKATGIGLGHPLESYSFEVEDQRVGFVAPPELVPESWQFAVATPSPAYCLAVAVRRADSIDRYEISLHNADSANDLNSW